MFKLDTEEIESGCPQALYYTTTPFEICTHQTVDRIGRI